MMNKAITESAIHRLFTENPNPSFAMIDAVGGGDSWPILQSLLGVESEREIPFALLARAEQQLAALKAFSSAGRYTNKLRIRNAQSAMQ